MDKTLDYQNGKYRALYKSLNAQWRALCADYLPVSPENSIWRFSREANPDDPEQGWKLHIPATVLTANQVLEKIAPCLRRRNVLFKAPASLQELDKINCGIYYGYAQVGKFITIYPQRVEEAAALARRLHQLTLGIAAPAVPYDLRFKPESRVYYRYGSFKLLKLESSESSDTTYAIRDPAGNLVPDVRDSETAKPDWVSDLFPTARPQRKVKAVETPLKTTFRVFRALSQRGKGGVYQALDLTARPRLCILKEGRSEGEVDWIGRDGYWRIKHEESVLSALRAAGINVPHVYSSFEAGKNYYLAIEFIEGVPLEKYLSRKKRRLAIARALALGIQLSALMARIHDAGWVWRDCKPHNLLLAEQGELRPLDFEGACPVNQPDAMPWGTNSYRPPEWDQDFRGQTRLPEDLYALGAVIYLLLTGRLPDAAAQQPIEASRPDVPPSVRELVMELLDAKPERRPSAHEAAERLQQAAASLKHRSRGKQSRSQGRQSLRHEGNGEKPFQVIAV
ncbi:MAG: serine/threonine protein kinase [Pyrinomonadaceae bacterium]|nr:serine/threonine protein kinase [Pyrinomonadaceae bacterium]